MRQLGTEEKAALLLTPIDDDDDENSSTKIISDNFPTISKRPKTYHRHRTSSSHSVLFFVLILSAFIFGCLTGVVIMIYRLSQDTEHSLISNTKYDLTIQKKLSQTILKTNFQTWNSSIETLNQSANRLEQLWKNNYTNMFHQIKQNSYDIILSKYSPSTQWSGIKLIDKKTDQELTKFNLHSSNEYITYSSLIKSGELYSKSIVYVNYGRDEDFAYLFKQNQQIDYETNQQTIVFMRKQSQLITQTEQIHQAIRYHFAGLVLFDDDDDEIDLHSSINTNDRQSFIDHWTKLSKTPKQQQQFLDEISIDDEQQQQQILVLHLSKSDVENIFSSIPSDSNHWLPIPNYWHSKSTSLKLGGELKQSQLRLISYIQEIPVHLPVVFGSIQGAIEQDHFIVLGYQLGQKQQEQIVNEIIRAFNVQMTNGWRPRRSILFCAWSGLSYDHYTIQRWISDNKQFITKNLVAYIDLGDGVLGNSTLNLHGSPLFEQIAQRTADFVVSPLVHDHTCHHRLNSMSSSNHIHRKRHDDDHQMNSHEQIEECQPHKLYDEWLRTTKNRFYSNKTYPIVQSIDTHSSAGFLQLNYGIPSLIIEMTDEQSVDNNTFYFRKLPSILSKDIQPEILVSYTQFLCEILRQLIDEPLIPFNLTNYADLIDKQTNEYFQHFQQSIRLLVSYLGDSNEMSQVIHDLTKTIRDNQLTIEKSAKNPLEIQQSNEKLIQFERLFLNGNSKHLFIGPAYGLTNTVVPYPSLSNILYSISTNPPTQFVDTIKYRWLNFLKHIQLIQRTLIGFDSLLSNL